MKASGFEKVTAVSREPGQEGFLFKYVCFNSISNSSIHLSPLKQRKNQGKHTGQIPYDLQ